MKAFLITGCCGTGKTWVMKQLIDHFKCSPNSVQVGLYHWRATMDVKIAIAGIYDNSTFEGSDKLSMAVMKSNNEVIEKLIGVGCETLICEGDRFTNSSFIRDFKPFIIRIDGDGSNGRKLRGSDQSKEHLQRIASRVSNIGQDVTVTNSDSCFKYIVACIERSTVETAWIVPPPLSAMDMFLNP